MERIKSFTINHDILVPGFYISRVDGDITTYDMRARRPNMGDYMSDLTMHSVDQKFRNCRGCDLFRTDGMSDRFLSVGS